jgi:hypothetical protein
MTVYDRALEFRRFHTPKACRGITTGIERAKIAPRKECEDSSHPVGVRI